MTRDSYPPVDHPASCLTLYPSHLPTADVLPLFPSREEQLCLNCINNVDVIEENEEGGYSSSIVQMKENNVACTIS